MLTSEQKQQKRKMIAKSTCDLFVQKGYVNITISEIAKSASIGKGTIYEYFKNKEQIVFELMGCLQEDYDLKLMKKLESSENKSTKEQMISLFDIYLSDDEIVQIQKKIYKEYLGVFISNRTAEMVEYNAKMMGKYTIILENIFKNAIQKEELSGISLKMISSIFATLDGFLILDEQKDVIYEYFDTLFLLLQNNKKV